MKFKILLLLSVVSFSTFASQDAQVAKNFEGRYELVKAKKAGGDKKCLKEMDVNVYSNGVYFQTDLGDLSFTGKDECSSREGDIGPIQIECTDFSANKLTYSRTSPITVVGYIRETKSADLSRDGQKLVIKGNSTLVPAGILRLWQDDKYTCEYKRIN